MNTKSKKIDYAIYNNPLLIPVLVKDTSINKGLLYRKLKHALPCRIGIEFELSGNFCEAYKKKYNVPYNVNTDKHMAKNYQVLEIISDSGRYADDSIYEIRVSIKDFHQLSGLYRFMQDLPEFCKLHENGGIHIHLDLSMYDWGYLSKWREACSYCNSRLTELQSHLPKYTGKFNRKNTSIQSKSNWINFSRLHTMEVRILPLTFDYKTLMSWIKVLVKFRQDLIHYCKLVDKSKIEKKRVECLGCGDLEEFDPCAEDTPATNHDLNRIHLITNEDVELGREGQVYVRYNGTSYNTYNGGTLSSL